MDRQVRAFGEVLTQQSFVSRSQGLCGSQEVDIDICLYREPLMLSKLVATIPGQ